MSDSQLPELEATASEWLVVADVVPTPPIGRFGDLDEWNEAFDTVVLATMQAVEDEVSA